MLLLAVTELSNTIRRSHTPMDTGLPVWLGRSAVGACFGDGAGWLMAAVWDLISLAIGLVIVLILRRLDGMFEDQKHYLLRLEAEREEKRRRDEFGDEPIEIDEQTISILKRWDEGLGD